MFRQSVRTLPIRTCSSILMLAFKGVSLTLVLIICAGVLFKHHFALDRAQLTLKGPSLSGIAIGVNIAALRVVPKEEITLLVALAQRAGRLRREAKLAGITGV